MKISRSEDAMRLTGKVSPWLSHDLQFHAVELTLEVKDGVATGYVALDADGNKLRTVYRKPLPLEMIPQDDDAKAFEAAFFWNCKKLEYIAVS